MNIKIAEIGSKLAEALNRAAYAGERVILERRGKPVAALVSMEDLKLLERLEIDADLRALRRAKREGGTPIPLEQVVAELGIEPKTPGKRRRRTG